MGLFLHQLSENWCNTQLVQLDNWCCYLKTGVSEKVLTLKTNDCHINGFDIDNFKINYIVTIYFIQI